MGIYGSGDAFGSLITNRYGPRSYRNSMTQCLPATQARTERLELSQGSSFGRTCKQRSSSSSVTVAFADGLRFGGTVNRGYYVRCRYLSNNGKRSLATSLGPSP